MKTDYYQKNRAEILERQRIYRLQNKEVIAERKKLDMVRYGDKRRAKRAEWRDRNREKLLLDRKKWFQDNKETIYEKRKSCSWTPEKQAAYIAEYRIKNKEKIADRLRRYKAENPGYYIKHRHLGLIRGALKPMTQEAKDRYIEQIGCTRTFFRAHIESKFKDGMTWENYGKTGWEIDHIIPCSSFDLTQEQDRARCFHYSNMQPLWKHENIKKGKKIIKQ